MTTLRGSLHMTLDKIVSLSPKDIPLQITGSLAQREDSHFV